MENTSGQGPSATVPAEIDRWNWGAFFLNWIWGIGNNTFIALLMFVPFFGLVMPFVLGAKGSAWAWRNKRWQSVEEFRSVQRKWARWSLVLIVAFIAIVGLLFMAISAGIKHSDAFQTSLKALEASPEFESLIGKPISTGFPLGSIELSGPSGRATLSYSVSGPKGQGTVYLEATKSMGAWRIDGLVLEEDKTGRRHDLAGPPSPSGAV